jgi:SPP1 family predicted phage head-tail adaptor
MSDKADVMKDISRVRRHSITIQKKTDTFDDNQNQVEKWADWKTLKAEKSALYGKEYYAAKAVGEEQAVVFTVRYVPFLDELNTVKHRLVFRGKPYDIKHIDYLPGETWIKIKAIERPGGECKNVKCQCK